jgi:hypothetical protein
MQAETFTSGRQLPPLHRDGYVGWHTRAGCLGNPWTCPTHRCPARCPGYARASLTEPTALGGSCHRQIAGEARRIDSSVDVSLGAGTRDDVGTADGVARLIEVQR